jgi:hypothetical protein
LAEIDRARQADADACDAQFQACIKPHLEKYEAAKQSLEICLDRCNTERCRRACQATFYRAEQEWLRNKERCDKQREECIDSYTVRFTSARKELDDEAKRTGAYIFRLIVAARALEYRAQEVLAEFSDDDPSLIFVDSFADLRAVFARDVLIDLLHLVFKWEDGAIRLAGERQTLNQLTAPVIT